MMESSSAFPGLEDLVDLGRGNEIDMRPTLLRVLTDLYLQRPIHSADDERYYTELALRLLDDSDVAARATLAARLAAYPSAPRAIIERLAYDEIEIAAPILKHSPCLSPADLAAIAAQRGGAHAELIANRPSTISSQAPAAAPREPPQAAEAQELCELFYAAGAPERRLILIHLEYAAIPPVEPAAFIQRADVWRLEGAALRHNIEAVVRELERALGLSRVQARRIISDDSGEPIVAVAKAMDLPGDVLQRLLLFMNFRIGQSVDRVYELAELYGEISVEAARRLVAIWRAADAAGNSRSGHEPVAWRTAAENARRALSEVSRRRTHSQELRLHGSRR